MQNGIGQLDPVIGLLQKELEVNRVPPGQEGDYFMNKGHPLDPRVLYMIQTNKHLKDNANRAQPPVSTVFDDLSAANVQEANAKFAPRPQMMAQAPQAQPQMMPQQQQPSPDSVGVGALPVNVPKFKAGGIVAFNGEDDDQVVKSIQDFVDSDETPDPYDASEQAGDTSGIGAGTPVAAAPVAGKIGPSKEYLDLARQSGSVADKIAADEAKRREEAIGKLDKNRTRDMWAALSQAGFESARGGARNIGEALGDIGGKFMANAKGINEKYEAAKETAMQASYAIKHANALREAGYPVQAMQMEQNAKKLAVDAKFKADKAATAKGLLDSKTEADRTKGTPLDVLNRTVIDPARRVVMNPDSTPEQRQAAQARIDNAYAEIDKHPSVYSPRSDVANIQGATQRDVANIRMRTAQEIQRLRNMQPKNDYEKRLQLDGLKAQLVSLGQQKANAFIFEPSEVARFDEMIRQVSTDIDALTKGSAAGMPNAAAATAAPAGISRPAWAGPAPAGGAPANPALSFYTPPQRQ